MSASDFFGIHFKRSQTFGIDSKKKYKRPPLNFLLESIPKNQRNLEWIPPQTSILDNEKAPAGMASGGQDLENPKSQILVEKKKPLRAWRWEDRT